MKKKLSTIIKVSSQQFLTRPCNDSTEKEKKSV